MTDKNTRVRLIPEVQELVSRHSEENSLVLRRKADRIMADSGNPFEALDALIRFLCDEMAYLRTEVTVNRLLDTGGTTMPLPGIPAGVGFPEARRNAPSAVNIWFGTVFDGAGWYAAEWLGSAQRALRWSGPEKVSTVRVRLSRQRALRIEWDVVTIFDPDTRLKDLGISVNGQVLQAEVEPWSEDGRSGRVWSVIPPLENSRSYLCEIGLHTPVVGSPAGRDPNSRDKRLLGVAISDMRVYPD